MLFPRAFPLACLLSQILLDVLVHGHTHAPTHTHTHTHLNIQTHACKSAVSCQACLGQSLRQGFGCMGQTEREPPGEREDESGRSGRELRKDWTQLQWTFLICRGLCSVHRTTQCCLEEREPAFGPLLVSGAPWGAVGRANSSHCSEKPGPLSSRRGSVWVVSATGTHFQIQYVCMPHRRTFTHANMNARTCSHKHRLHTGTDKCTYTFILTLIQADACS